MNTTQAPNRLNHLCMPAESSLPTPARGSLAELPKQLGHYTGRVVWFSNTLGLGFLERHDGSDVVCRFSDVLNPGYGILQQDELVEFDVVRGEDGPCAANVRRISEQVGPAIHAPIEQSQSPQATIAMWRRGAHKVKRLLRKTPLPLAKVTYNNGCSSECLSARGLAIEERPEKTIVAIDLSSNEDRGTAPYTSYVDAMGLKNNLGNLNYVQLRRDSCPHHGLARLLAKASGSVIELAIRFKDGMTRTLPARVEHDSSSLWFYAIEGHENYSFPWWRRPRR